MIGKHALWNEPVANALPDVRTGAPGRDISSGRIRDDFVSDALWLKDLVLFGSLSTISSYEYVMLRRLLLAHPPMAAALPMVVRICPTLREFRDLVDEAIPARPARQRFLIDQFSPLIALAHDLAEQTSAH